MKAAILKKAGGALTIDTIDRPVLAEDEVLVKLCAAALNHRDVWIQKGLYPKMSLPVVLGSDGAGVVADVGNRVNPQWLGQEVIINPSQNWGDNPEFYSEDYQILGMPANGTFAEYVKVRAEYLSAKPAHLSWVEASAVPLCGLTAWRALMTRAHVAMGERVLITGAGGGVAGFLIQFAVAAGAEVWVTSGSDEKLGRAMKLGAVGGCNYNASEWHRDLLLRAGAHGKGYFDVIMDGAAGESFPRLIDLAAPGGRICIYGGTAGNITSLVPARVFFKQLHIMGTTMGTPAEFSQMIRFMSEKQISPIIDAVFPLAEAEQAMKYMDLGEQFGKIVLQISQSPAREVAGISDTHPIFPDYQ